MRKTFSGTVAAKINENLHLIPYGVEEQFIPQKGDRGSWIVPYNRMSEGQKKVSVHARVSLTASQVIGMSGEVPKSTFFVGPGLADVTDEFYRDVYDVQPQPGSREDYIRNAQGSGMFISTSAYESFGLMYLELLCCGVVGVFANAQWNKLLLPDYKFKAPPGDLSDLVVRVYEDFDASYAYVVEEVVPWIRDRYSIATFSDRVRSLLLPEGVIDHD